MESVEKGVRVAIVKGRKGNGVVGTVFWIGEDKYNEGQKRLGVRGDDGETYWVSADNVELTDVPEAEPEEPDYEKGDRVTYEHRGEEGIGEVFWVGPSKHGPGYRVGLKIEGEEDLWLDSRQVKARIEGDLPALDGGDEAPPELGEPPPFEPGDPGMTEAPAGVDEWDDEDPPF